MQIPKKATITSIRSRLTLWSVFVLALVLVTMGVILRYTLQIYLMASIDRELTARGRTTEAWMVQMFDMAKRYPPPQRNRTELISNRTSTGKEADNSSLFRFRPRMFNLYGRPMYPGSNDVLWDRAAFARARHGESNHITMQSEKESVRLYSMPLYHQGRRIGVMQAACSLTEMERDLQGLSNTLIILIPISLLIVGAGATFLMGRLLRPVREITQTAAQISAADLSQRLPVTGEDEFSRLSTTFNAMLARLEESFEQQRRFAADASHELRTPLTAIKARTSLALYGEKTSADYRRALEIADRAATRMSRIVEDLLLLARSDTGQLHLEFQSVPIRQIVEAAVEAIQGREYAPIYLQLPEISLSVLGDSSHLIRLFTNLLDNAAQHTPVEGCITLTVEGEADRVQVTILDTGAGIAPEHLPHLTERFYRVDESRTRKQGGAGLGLSICQSILEAHHGHLSIDSVFGEGTMVTVSLPKALPPAFTPSKGLQKYHFPDVPAMRV